MDLDELQELLVVFDADGSRPSIAEQLSLMKALRKSKIRRSDLVIKYGVEMTKSSRSLPEQEVLSLHEQIVIAALDMRMNTLATENLQLLLTKFPKSLRVQRLLGMQFEALGKFADAIRIYDEILMQNPANMLAMKRKVCVHLACGKVADAVDELQAILKIFPSDVSCWMELADLYLSASDYTAAAHCYEEVVMLDVANAHAHTRLADTYYTIGDYEDYVSARKHYVMSLEIQGPRLNLRALYGLIAACQAVNDSASTGSKNFIRSVPSTAASASSATLGVTPAGAVIVSKHDAAVNTALLSWAHEQLASVAADTVAGDAVAIVAEALK